MVFASFSRRVFTRDFSAFVVPNRTRLLAASVSSAPRAFAFFARLRLMISAIVFGLRAGDSRTFVKPRHIVVVAFALRQERSLEEAHGATDQHIGGGKLIARNVGSPFQCFCEKGFHVFEGTEAGGAFAVPAAKTRSNDGVHRTRIIDNPCEVIAAARVVERRREDTCRKRVAQVKRN